jgi:hypothetical protein
VWGSGFTTKVATAQGGSAETAARLKRNLCDLRAWLVREALPSRTAEYNLEQQLEKSCASAAKLFLCYLGCAHKSAGTRESPKYLARRLATAGLQLATAIRTRTMLFALGRVLT